MEEDQPESNTDGNEDDMAKYNLDEYDEEDDMPSESQNPLKYKVMLMTF